MKTKSRVRSSREALSRASHRLLTVGAGLVARPGARAVPHSGELLGCAGTLAPSARALLEAKGVPSQGADGAAGAASVSDLAVGAIR